MPAKTEDDFFGVEVQRRESRGQSNWFGRRFSSRCSSLRTRSRQAALGLHSGLTRHRSRGYALTKIFARVDVQ